MKENILIDKSIAFAARILTLCATPDFLGKDEVAGSIPANSSRKPQMQMHSGFSFLLITYLLDFYVAKKVILYSAFSLSLAKISLSIVNNTLSVSGRRLSDSLMKHLNKITGT